MTTDTGTVVVVTSISAIPPGEGRTSEVAGERVAIFNTREAGVFATQPNALTKQHPLAGGLVGGSTLICPLHSWKFDLAKNANYVGRKE